MFASAGVDTVPVIDHRAVRVHRGGAPVQYSTVQYSTVQYTVHSTGDSPGDAVVLPGAAGPVPPLLVHEGKHTPLPVLSLTTWNF